MSSEIPRNRKTNDNPVSIPAEEARFDRDGDLVRTELTWSQIQAMSNSQKPTYDDDY